MKKIFLFLVIFALSFGVKAQSWTPIFGKQRFASGLGIPTKDSTYFAGAADSSLIYINPKDAGLYYKYKGYHKKVGTGTVSSIALTMPSAFSVSGSPITNSGSFVVTGAGSITQYIRGDGSLATFAGAPGTLPVGGTSGQILAKIDGTNYNTEWIDNYSTQIKNIVKLGAALSKGTPVYVSSANGTNMIVSASSYDTEATSSKTFGLLETGGALNDQVKVVTYGLLAGLNTGTAAAGDPVWLGANGALIYGYANKPHAPYHMVFIGIVTRAQSVNGEIFVNVQNGFELDELHNVAAQTPSNNDGLFYESSTSLWKNKSIATVLGYTPEQPLTFSAPLSRSVNTVSIPAATNSVNGYLSSTDWTTFNSKQAQINGTGFVKASGTTISYDNSTYLTTTAAASTYVPYTGATSAVNIGNNVLTSGYSILNGSGLTNEAGVLSLLKGTSRAVQGNGYTNLYAEAGKVGFVDWITGNVRTFELSLASLTAGTTRVYTLPNASGTIALTSNLSGYVTGSGTSGILPIWNGTNSLTLSQVFDNGSTVSIGNSVTSPNKLVSFSSNASGFAILGSGSAGAGGVYAAITSGTGNMFQGSTSNGGYFISDNSGNTYISGKVGIGTFSSSSYNLNVVGTGYFSSNLTASQLYSGSSTHGYLNLTAVNAGGNEAGIFFNINGNKWEQYTAANDLSMNWYSYALSSVALKLNPTGNLSIGSNTDAGYKLDVNGTARISGALSGTSATFSGKVLTTASGNDTFGFQMYKSGSTTTIAGFYQNTTGDGLIAAYNSSGTQNVQIATNGASYFNGGNVGIGTTSPTAFSGYTTLTIDNTSGSFTEYRQGGTNTFRVGSNESSGGFLYTQGSTPIRFGTIDTERMRITSGGNVLIGTTTDVGQKFVVNGGVATIDNYLTMRSTVNSTNYGFINEGNGLVKLANIGVSNLGQFSMSTGIYTPLSDRNKKKDFEDSNIGLKEVLQLKPTLYRMKTDTTQGEKELGFIAQEVKGIIPSAYQQNGDFIGLSFNPIVAALTKAIQELNQKIVNLEAQIKQ